MNEELTGSRPKVHRLPQNMVEEGGLYVSRTVVIICLALLLVVLIPALLSFRKVEKHNIASSVKNAQDVALGSLAPAAGNITVRDDAAQMVGQIAKMPAQMQSDVHVKSNNNPEIKQDNSKELLEIIGKY